jgi:hypothetical protein
MTRLRGLVFAALATSLLAACVSTGTQSYRADLPLRPAAQSQPTP